MVWMVFAKVTLGNTEREKSYGLCCVWVRRVFWRLLCEWKLLDTKVVGTRLCRGFSHLVVKRAIEDRIWVVATGLVAHPVFDFPDHDTLCSADAEARVGTLPVTCLSSKFTPTTLRLVNHERWSTHYDEQKSVMLFSGLVIHLCCLSLGREIVYKKFLFLHQDFTIFRFCVVVLMQLPLPSSFRIKLMTRIT